MLICGNSQGYVRYPKEFLGRQRDRHSRHSVQFPTWKFLTAWFVAFLQLCTCLSLRIYTCTLSYTFHRFVNWIWIWPWLRFSFPLTNQPELYPWPSLSWFQWQSGNPARSIKTCWHVSELFGLAREMKHWVRIYISFSKYVEYGNWCKLQLCWLASCLYWNGNIQDRWALSKQLKYLDTDNRRASDGKSLVKRAKAHSELWPL